jgi:hypothetical protein
VGYDVRIKADKGAVPFSASFVVQVPSSNASLSVILRALSTFAQGASLDLFGAIGHKPTLNATYLLLSSPINTFLSEGSLSVPVGLHTIYFAGVCRCPGCITTADFALSAFLTVQNRPIPFPMIPGALTTRLAVNGSTYGPASFFDLDAASDVYSRVTFVNVVKPETVIVAFKRSSPPLASEAPSATAVSDSFQRIPVGPVPVLMLGEACILAGGLDFLTAHPFAMQTPTPAGPCAWARDDGLLLRTWRTPRRKVACT